MSKVVISFSRWSGYFIIFEEIPIVVVYTSVAKGVYISVMYKEGVILI